MIRVYCNDSSDSRPEYRDASSAGRLCESGKDHLITYHVS